MGWQRLCPQTFSPNTPAVLFQRPAATAHSGGCSVGHRLLWVQRGAVCEIPCLCRSMEMLLCFGIAFLVSKAVERSTPAVTALGELAASSRAWHRLLPAAKRSGLRFKYIAFDPEAAK